MRQHEPEGPSDAMLLAFAMCLSGPSYDFEELWLFDLNREALEKTAEELEELKDKTADIAEGKKGTSRLFPCKEIRD